jgi:uncharacterized protein YjiS (DUF1127 family)/RimJ/RimL family protein N-acetyltransferase
MPPQQTNVTFETGRDEFIAYHLPALEQDEARHSLILANLDRLARGLAPNLRCWTLGAGGACAVQTVGWPIVLGELDHGQCHALAEATLALDYPGVVGPDRTALWFAGHAAALGLTFSEPIPQRIHALQERPVYPGASGYARVVDAAGADLYADWTIAFLREAVPHDPVPSRERIKQAAAEGHALFWIVDGEPVSTATIARRTRQTAAISRVYTPPRLRGQGYAGSVTAALVDRIFAEGRTAACLYTDLRNPISNRCYANIGFKPVCGSWHFPRSSLDSPDTVLGRNVSITLVKDAVDDTLEAALPNASIAALDGALSRQDATGQTGASTRRASSFLKRCWRAFQEGHRRQRSRASLHYLSDRELMDIGITHGEIDCIAAHRAIDRLRDGTTYLWIRSRGVM